MKNTTIFDIPPWGGCSVTLDRLRLPPIFREWVFMPHRIDFYTIQYQAIFSKNRSSCLSSKGRFFQNGQM